MLCTNLSDSVVNFTLHLAIHNEEHHKQFITHELTILADWGGDNLLPSKAPKLTPIAYSTYGTSFTSLSLCWAVFSHRSIVENKAGGEGSASLGWQDVTVNGLDPDRALSSMPFSFTDEENALIKKHNSPESTERRTDTT